MTSNLSGGQLTKSFYAKCQMCLVLCMPVTLFVVLLLMPVKVMFGKVFFFLPHPAENMDDLLL